MKKKKNWKLEGQFYIAAMNKLQFTWVDVISFRGGKSGELLLCHIHVDLYQLGLQREMFKNLSISNGCIRYKFIGHIVNNIRLTQNLTYVLKM